MRSVTSVCDALTSDSFDLESLESSFLVRLQNLPVKFVYQSHRVIGVKVKVTGAKMRPRVVCLQVKGSFVVVVVVAAAVTTTTTTTTTTTISVLGVNCQVAHQNSRNV